MKLKKYLTLGALFLLVLPVCFLNACAPVENVTIALGGDIMLARDGSPIFQASSAFGDAMDIFQKADLSAANLESPVSDRFDLPEPGIKYNLCAKPSDLQVLRNSGIQFFSIINNHSDDCGNQGALATEKLLEEAKLSSITSNLREVKIDGQRFGLIAVEDVTAPLDISSIALAVSKAKANGDFVIVSIHWGMEYQAGTTEEQRKIALELAEAGADVIWGHHPHILQKMEWIENAEDDHRTLVIYSLGNLLSDQAMLEDAQRTAVVILKVREKEIKGIEIVPLMMGFPEKKLQKANKVESGLIFDSLEFSRLSMSH